MKRIVPHLKDDGIKKKLQSYRQVLVAQLFSPATTIIINVRIRLRDLLLCVLRFVSSPPTPLSQRVSAVATQFWGKVSGFFSCYSRLCVDGGLLYPPLPYSRVGSKRCPYSLCVACILFFFRRHGHAGDDAAVWQARHAADELIVRNLEHRLEAATQVRAELRGRLARTPPPTGIS